MAEAIRACYAGGPIDAIDIEQARDWQDHLAELCPDVLFFFPAFPYRNATIESADVLDKINRAAIDACKCTLIYLPEGRPAFGSYRECEYSAYTKKFPTLVVTTGLQSLLRYDLDVVETLEEAAEWLINKRWPLQEINPLGDIAPIHDVRKYPPIKKCGRGPSYNHWPHRWETEDCWCPGDLVELG